MVSFMRHGRLAAVLATALVFGGCGTEVLEPITEDILIAPFAGEDRIAARDKARRDADRRPDDPDALKALGWGEFALERFQDAERAFEKLGDVKEDSFDAALGQAWIRIETGRYEEATHFLDEAERRAPPFDRQMVRNARGWLALKQGAFSDAERLFTFNELGALFGAGPVPDGRQGLGWLALRQGEPDKAKGLFLRGIHMSASCHYCYEGLARAAIETGDLDAALSMTLRGLKIVRHDYGLARLLDDILGRMGKPAVSERSYEALIRTYPDDPLYYAALGEALLANGKLEASRERFQRAWTIAPGNVRAARGLAAFRNARRALAADAWAHHLAWRHTEALVGFDAKREEAKASRNPTAEDGRGWVLLALNRPREALAAFRLALRIDPRHIRSKAGLVLARRAAFPELTLAWEYMNKRDDANAERILRLLDAKYGPEAIPFANEALGWIAYYQGRRAEAASAFIAAHGGSRDTFYATWGLGLIGLERRDHRAAARSFLISLETQPYQGESAYQGVAGALMKAGRYEDARKILYLGERTYPNSAAIQALLGKAETALGDRTLGWERARLAKRFAAKGGAVESMAIPPPAPRGP